MTIRLGTLLPGAVPLPVGRSKPVKGFAWMPDGTQQMVIAKRGAPKLVAAEIFCAELGRACDLPIPEPLLLRDPVRHAYLFGSAYHNYPNLLQWFRVDEGSKRAPEQLALIVKRIMEWSRVADVISFDEWIHNVDRNLQNLLWDGYDEFLLIDHAGSLGLASGTRDVNKLITACVNFLADDEAIDIFKERVLDTVIKLDASNALEAAGALKDTPLTGAGAHGSAFVTFVGKRLPRLATLLAARFPTPQMGLEGM